MVGKRGAFIREGAFIRNYTVCTFTSDLGSFPDYNWLTLFMLPNKKIYFPHENLSELQKFYDTRCA